MNPLLISWIVPLVLSPFIGSFLGVVATRATAPRSILWGRSICDACGHTLGPADMVPLASWVAAFGKCRYCKHRVSLFYPTMELGAVAVAAWSAILTSGWLLWVSCAFGWALLALAAIDWREYLLPDFLTLPLIPAGLIVAGTMESDALTPHAIGAAAGYAFVVAVRWIYEKVRGREGIGLGDAKLLAASGAWVSWIGLPSVVLTATVLALAYALLRSARAGTLSVSDRVPFGTFLCLGTWLIWLYGPLA